MSTARSSATPVDLVERLALCRRVLAGKYRSEATRTARSPGVISFAHGEGVCRPALACVDALIRSTLAAGKWSLEKYSYLVRHDELLEGITRSLDAQGVRTELWPVAVDAGSTPLFINALMQCRRGDSPIFIGPGFYHSFINWSQLVGVRLLPISETHALTAEGLTQAIQCHGTPSALVVINPTYGGEIYSATALAPILEICRRHQIAIIEDAVFQGTEFDDLTTSLLSLCETDDRVVSINSVSKRFALANIRVGWAVGERSIVESLQQQADIRTVSVPYLCALVAAAALRQGATHSRLVAQECAIRARLVTKTIASIDAELQAIRPAAKPWVTATHPRSGQNVFLQFPALAASSSNTAIQNSLDLTSELLEHEDIAVSPALANGLDDFACRLSFAGVGAHHTYAVQSPHEHEIARRALAGDAIDFAAADACLWSELEEPLASGRKTISSGLDRLAAGLRRIIEAEVL